MGGDGSPPAGPVLMCAPWGRGPRGPRRHRPGRVRLCPAGKSVPCGGEAGDENAAAVPAPFGRRQGHDPPIECLAGSVNASRSRQTSAARTYGTRPGKQVLSQAPIESHWKASRQAISPAAQSARAAMTLSTESVCARQGCDRDIRAGRRRWDGAGPGRDSPAPRRTATRGARPGEGSAPRLPAGRRVGSSARGVARVRRGVRGSGIVRAGLGRWQSAGIDQFEEEVFRERIRPPAQDTTQCFTIRGEPALGRPERYPFRRTRHVREQPADPPVPVGLSRCASSRDGGGTDTA